MLLLTVRKAVFFLEKNKLSNYIKVQDCEAFDCEQSPGLSLNPAW